MTRNTVQSWEPHRNACLGSFPSNKRASVILTVDSLKSTYLAVLGLPLYSELCFQSGEGNGTAVQYSCLENPRDGGAW